MCSTPNTSCSVGEIKAVQYGGEGTVFALYTTQGFTTQHTDHRGCHSPHLGQAQQTDRCCAMRDSGGQKPGLPHAVGDQRVVRVPDKRHGVIQQKPGPGYQQQQQQGGFVYQQPAGGSQSNHHPASSTGGVFTFADSPVYVTMSKQQQSPAPPPSKKVVQSPATVAAGYNNNNGWVPAATQPVMCTCPPSQHSGSRGSTPDRVFVDPPQQPHKSRTPKLTGSRGNRLLTGLRRLAGRRLGCSDPAQVLAEDKHRAAPERQRTVRLDRDRAAVTRNFYHSDLPRMQHPRLRKKFGSHDDILEELAGGHDWANANVRHGKGDGEMLNHSAEFPMHTGVVAEFSESSSTSSGSSCECTCTCPPDAASGDHNSSFEESLKRRELLLRKRQSRSLHQLPNVGISDLIEGGGVKQQGSDNDSSLEDSGYHDFDDLQSAAHLNGLGLHPEFDYNRLVALQRQEAKRHQTASKPSEPDNSRLTPAQLEELEYRNKLNACWNRIQQQRRRGGGGVRVNVQHDPKGQQTSHLARLEPNKVQESNSRGQSVDNVDVRINPPPALTTTNNNNLESCSNTSTMKTEVRTTEARTALPGVATTDIRSTADVRNPGVEHRAPALERTDSSSSSSSSGPVASLSSSNTGPLAQSSSKSSPRDSPNGSAVIEGPGLVTIRMKPDSLGRFGFNVKGGADQGMPIIVSRVAPGTPADICIPRLNEGDQVLYINGRDVSTHTHEQVVMYIRASRETHSGGELSLIVRPNVYIGEDTPEEPDFQYIPDTPPAVSGSGGAGGLTLEASMVLLQEGLDSGAALTQFEQLYRKKPGLTMNAARLSENIARNRYRDISPYDQTRVKIKGSGGDYINANFVNMEIPGSGIVNRYIAAQGPLPNTCADFWTMVWEQHCTLVVMLTTNVERGRVKCHQYWPDLYETADFGPLQVTCLKEDASQQSFSFREFTLMGEGHAERHITQMQYSAWPDHGVPDDSADFLSFVDRVRHKRCGMVEPTVVHCSAGIGRTGVLITMETALCLIEAGQPVLPLDITRQMRDQRAMLIQTASQYKFVCEAILRVYNEKMVQPLDDYKR